MPTSKLATRNALRYAAGYVPRALRKKLERSSHQYKEMILCSMDKEESETPTTDDSTEWVEAVDRGGLYHVNQATYFLFLAMEEVRRHLRCHSAHKGEGIKEKLTHSIMMNEEILFHWEMVCANWEEEESRALFAMVVNLWVTMRGFAFASSWMELYKQTSKKSTQKSKGLRRKLQSGTEN